MRSGPANLAPFPRGRVARGCFANCATNCAIAEKNLGANRLPGRAIFHDDQNIMWPRRGSITVMIMVMVAIMPTAEQIGDHRNASIASMVEAWQAEAGLE